ncbi:CPBP family intramembrane glutamic endopeptidase [Lacticaseibacillus saniviri]|uniref:CAAX prenyl protease 2/Lysostaphin resistance protein A-like domain-containing protein n=1 Tax=Lacticaseibacillus saniviri JCM 17471 = DSM 24301 TaxID=1293598 RepID=A0A0R2MQN0_9LACO|nr:type II CAAX endopeptidase family protein [Lacticaseibacillus saniviri]KRO15924.1 hypothetical protein IV56_GL002115 [Lacticaseibacillus saniviri JCM 17471 = DSM 24301]MCG4282808.1 CPBP family intramembrane metalloprotease [Lacticaseibacillus saniviri]
MKRKAYLFIVLAAFAVDFLASLVVKNMIVLLSTSLAIRLFLLLLTIVFFHDVYATSFRRAFPKGQPIKWLGQVYRLAGYILLAGAVQFLAHQVNGFLPALPTPEVILPKWQVVIFQIVPLLIAPFIEEFAFRFVLINPDSSHVGRQILWSSLFFALMHTGYLSVGEVLFAFIMGLILGWIYSRTRNILDSIALHFFANFFSIAI